MVSNYGSLAVKSAVALGVVALADRQLGEDKKVLWKCNTAAHVVTIIAANLLSKNEVVCSKLAAAVQIYAGLTLIKTAIENHAPASVKNWTADYMKPLVNLVAGTALATVLARRDFNINKF